mgnify:CR=1 FL=1
MRKYDKKFKKEVVKLSVSESGYYHSLSCDCDPRFWQLFLAKIKQVYAQHPDNDNYGVNRVWLAFEQDGITMSKSTVRRAMKKGGLIKASPRRSGSLTESDANAQKYLTRVSAAMTFISFSHFKFIRLIIFRLLFCLVPLYSLL